MDIDTLILKINKNIINPFIAFLFVLATLLFLSGLVQYFFADKFGGGGKGGVEGHETGKRHMVWGLVGMFLMISVFGIMRLIVNTLGVDLSQFGAEIPSN
jgi:hypothetical protein